MVGHSASLLLISAVAGYWVLERASMHKGNLKSIGQFLGGVIILVSLLGVACKVWYAVGCQLGKAGGYCPFMSKMSPAPSK